MNRYSIFKQILCFKLQCIYSFSFFLSIGAEKKHSFHFTIQMDGCRFEKYIQSLGKENVNHLENCRFKISILNFVSSTER